MSRLLTQVAPLALLLLFAASAQAETYFVDLDGGSDTVFDGKSATATGGSVGPFMTINKALTAAGNNDTIVILASVYTESFTITQDNLTISSLPEGGDRTVRLTGTVTIGTTANAAPGVQFTSMAGAGTTGVFTLNTPTFTIANGSVNVGSSITTIGDGAEVTIVRTNGTFDGTPTFASTPNVTYNGNASTAATSEIRTTFVGTSVNTNPTLTVAFTGATAAAPKTLTLPTAINFGTGAIVNVAANNIIAGTQTVSGVVTFNGPGRFGFLDVVSGGNLTVGTDISAGGLSLSGTGVVNAGANTITLFGNFAQNGGLTTFQAGSLAFDGTGSYTFSPLGGFLVSNLGIGVGPTTNPTVTFAGDATVLAGGAFRVETGATAVLAGNLVNIGTGGTSTSNGTITTGIVAFRGTGGQIAGTGVYDGIIAFNGDVNIVSTQTSAIPSTTVPSAFTFTGQLNLAGGGLNSGVTATTDISPAGPLASVFVNITTNGGNNRINGTEFNGKMNAFDLTYEGTNGAYTVGDEFDTEYIDDLKVNATGFVNAAGVGITGPAGGNDTIDGTVMLTTPGALSTSTATKLTVNFPSYNVDIAKKLTVGDDVFAQVLTPGGAMTGDLMLLAADNSVLGTIGGPGRLVLGAGTVGVTATGYAAANNAATISTTNGLFIAGGSTATVSGLRTIATTISDGNTTAAPSSLSLGLARDGAASAFAGAGDVTGVVTLNGGFTLTSDVQFNSALTLNGANVAIGDNDIVFNDGTLTLNGQTVTGMAGEFQFIAAGGSTFDPQVATVPGVNIIAPTTLVSRVTAIKTFRIASTFDANTGSDFNTTGPSTGDDFLTLAVNGTIALADNAVVVGDTDPARKEVVLAGAFNFRNEQTQLFSSFAVTLLGSPELITFTSAAGTNNYQSLPEVGVGFPITVPATFTVTNFVQESGRFNLAGRNIEVTGNTTFTGTAPIVNLQGGVPTSATTDVQIQALAANVQRNNAADPYSEFRFTGGSTAASDSLSTLTLTGLNGAPGAYIGSGVDLVLNKAGETSRVNLVGGALLFDDQFTPNGVTAPFVQDTPNDETFVLARGTFAMDAKTPANRAMLYVNLDHENTTTGRTAEATTDDGQGFVFRAPSTDNVPVAQIAGTIQKRIISDPNASATGFTPGRVVNPLGDKLGEYAEFVFDFESIQREQNFGRRDLRTSFLKMAPGGSLGLPIQDGVSPGVAVGSTGNFQWLVTSNPTLGANTEFNVEARYDGYSLVGGQSVADLRLVRRQFGDETMNPFTLVSNSYDNFLIDPSSTVAGDEEPTVVAQNAQALLGPQGTLFSFGLRAVTPTDVASFQVVNNAPSGGPVDVYVGNTLIANNLPFGEATAYQTVTGVGTSPTNLTVTVAPESSTSPSAAGSRNFTATASQGATYAVVVFNDGMDATTGDPYDAVIYNTQRTTSGSSDTVELLAINGSKDAGRIDIGLKEAPTPFFRDLQFGEAGIGFQTGLDATLFRFDVSEQGTGTPFYTGNLDLSTARGERGLLIAQGLRTPPVGQPTRGFRLIFVRPDGTIITSGNSVATNGTTDVPAEFALRGTAPNPFRTTTSVRFDLPEAAEVQVEVYDALGRRVMQTAPSTMAPGANQGVEVNGNGLAAGLYVYRLTARGESQSWSQTGQITVLR